MGLSNESQAIATSMLFDDFGNWLYWDSNWDYYTYTGQEYDWPLTDAYNLRAREYYPEYGRFMQEDPIGNNGGSLNWYLYVANNPVNAIDPLGLKACCSFPVGFSFTGAVLSGTSIGTSGYVCIDECGKTRIGSIKYLCSCFGLGFSAGVNFGPLWVCKDKISDLIGPNSDFWFISGSYKIFSLSWGGGWNISGGVGPGVGGFYCGCLVQP